MSIVNSAILPQGVAHTLRRPPVDYAAWACKLTILIAPAPHNEHMALPCLNRKHFMEVLSTMHKSTTDLNIGILCTQNEEGEELTRTGALMPPTIPRPLPS
jgi:hypothetical protein